ncbi:hypothetical protein F4810DRAFT_669718 [Camillea tinctor]|nr:hypothetical protein F4810DRAFT_669718 [Camillea tinctor]
MYLFLFFSFLLFPFLNSDQLGKVPRGIQRVLYRMVAKNSSVSVEHIVRKPTCAPCQSTLPMRRLLDLSVSFICTRYDTSILRAGWVN